jgi:hypothetical protein
MPSPGKAHDMIETDLNPCETAHVREAVERVARDRFLGL